MRRTLAFAAVAALVAALMPGTAPASSSCDWPMYGHDLGHSFASPCTTISPLNVSTLIPKWFVNTSAPVTASPSVVDGVVYVGAADGTFYAVDANDGTTKWTFTVTDSNHSDYGAITSSASIVSVDGTSIVLFGGGSTLYALDASSGTLLAQECFDPRTNPSVQCNGSEQTIEIESSPAVVVMPNGETHVVIGMDFNESPNVGRAGVVSLNLAHAGSSWDLVPLWKFDPETLLTYTSDPIHAGGTGTGCGNVWSSPAVDAAANLVFFGVGNCDVRPSPLEPGDGESIDAIRLDTGTLVWRYMPRPADNDLDLDYGASAQLLPGGRVGEGGKDGNYATFDRSGGTLDWSTHVATASDLGGMIGSSAVGKAGGKDAVFTTNAIPFSTRDPQTSFEENLSTPNHMFALHAVDAITGDVLWDAPIPLPSYAAATYSNGVVFLSDTFGFSIQAYDADLGVPLWAFPLLGAPSSGAAIVGDSIYVGSGTAADPAPVGNIGGIWGFKLAVTL